MLADRCAASGDGVLGSPAFPDELHGGALVRLVVVMADEPLDLPGNLVTLQEIPDPTDGHMVVAYRYTGARLLAYGNDRWFLITNLPRDGYRSSVSVLRDTESIRSEVATPGTT